MRLDMPPLYQAFLDDAGVITVKPFDFDFGSLKQVFRD